MVPYYRPLSKFALYSMPLEAYVALVEVVEAVYASLSFITPAFGDECHQFIQIINVVKMTVIE